MIRLLPAVLLLLLADTAAAHCVLPQKRWTQVTGEGVTLAWRVAKPADGIRVGRTFDLEVAACLGSGEVPRRIRVAADMPAHGHGMNYKPTLTTLAPGRIRLEGLLFHMPGRWRFTFDVWGTTGRKRATATVDINR